MKRNIRLVIFILLVQLSLFTTSATMAYDVLNGSGTEGDPYLIEDLADFDLFADPDAWDPSIIPDYWSTGVHTQLMSDIDLAGRTYTTAVIAPDTITGYLFEGKTFNGVFMGAGYAIHNLTINTGTILNHYLGLFGMIDGNASKVMDLGVVNANITANNTSHYVGALCSRIGYGTIENCYTSGNVTSGHKVGGLCGLNLYGTIFNSYSTANANGVFRVAGLCGTNRGDIESCFATGAIVGDGEVGGLCGINNGETNIATVTNSYATGIVTGDSKVGGLCGSNKQSTIANSYATGNVTGNSDVGGFCGYSDQGTTTNSFWDTATTGQNNSAGGMGKTTAEMQTESTFTDVGWDFGATWTIHDTIDYPRLQWYTGPIPFDNQTEVSLTPYLSWGAVANAIAYDVYLGTASVPIVLVASGITETSYDPGHLFADTIYYWRIDTITAAETIVGDVWQFTTADGKPSNPQPSSGQTTIGLTTNLNWSLVTGASSYDVYLGTDAIPTQLLAGGIIDTNVDTGYLYASTTYYWRVDTITPVETIVGDVWQFTTADAKASNPQPANKALFFGDNVTLSWSPVNIAESYDIYFGDSYPPSLLASHITETSFDPSIPSIGSIYYWRIDVNTPLETITGDDWDYTLLTDLLAGSGTPLDPYLIENQIDFELFSNLDVLPAGVDPNIYYSDNVCTKLMTDIDLSGKTYSQAVIGNGATMPNSYDGIFDGNGHVISNLTIDTGFNLGHYIGLFGRLNAASATIMNLGVVNVNIITTRDYVGGLCGYALGTISNSYTTGNVTGDDYVGGLCGTIDGTITDSYSTVNVTGDYRVGGLCGSFYGTTTNSYAAGYVTGYHNTGGLFGANYSGSVFNSFWDIETTGQNTSVGGIGKTTAEMQTESTFTDVGWDFTMSDGDPRIWYMNGYPQLNQTKIVYEGLTTIALAENNNGTIQIEIASLIDQPLNWTITGIGTPNCHWITSVTPAAGMLLNSSETTTVSINIDTIGLPVGEQVCNLILSADNGDLIPIQITLHVYNQIDIEEIALLSEYWQMSGCNSGAACEIVDWYIDGEINVLDLQQLALSWLSAKILLDPNSISDDFESGNLTTLNWQHGGDKYWTVHSGDAAQGIFSAKSGNVSDGQSSSLTLTIDDARYTTISFYTKVSSEPSDDYLIFYINGVEQEKWSGTELWALHTYSFTPGLHTFKWSYTQSDDEFMGSDAAWIDDIQIY